MISRTSISVLTPVHNEAHLLQPALKRIDEFLRANFQDYEIIVIESGSTDGSDRLSDQIANDHPRIKIIHEGGRYGFGSALKKGYAEAAKALVWLVTVDLPFHLESIYAALPYLSQYDCVLSYRSQDDRNLGKKFRSLVYNNLVKYSLGLKVRHVNSAFKLYKRELIQSLSLESNGWFIDTEIIYRLQKKGIRLIEIPVELIDRQTTESSVQFSSVLGTIRELMHFLKTKDQ